MGYNSRLLDRRIERQRRNMTDPTQHSSSNVAPVLPPDERHVIIMKRNSLNDKSNQRSGGGTNSHELLLEHQPKLINLCGDSTSTIMSTDSGMSSTSNCCELNDTNDLKSQNGNAFFYKQPVPLSPTSPEPVYSMSISSSSSSGSSKYDSLMAKTTPKKTSSSLLHVINNFSKSANSSETKGELASESVKPITWSSDQTWVFKNLINYLQEYLLILNRLNSKITF